MTGLTVYVVYRRTGRVWQPVSRSFRTEAMARRYIETLPRDWTTEIRAIATEAT